MTASISLGKWDSLKSLLDPDLILVGGIHLENGLRFFSFVEYKFLKVCPYNSLYFLHIYCYASTLVIWRFSHPLLVNLDKGSSVPLRTNSFIDSLFSFC